MSALGDRALALLRRLEFGEPYGRRGVHGFVRACPDCENEISEGAAEESVDRYAHRHNPGCVLASILDEARGIEPLPAVPRGHCARCDRCGWALKPDIREGCVLGNCSQRPLPDLRTHCVCGAPYASSEDGTSPPPPAKPLTLTKESVRDLTPRPASPPPTMAPPIDVPREEEAKR